jgi:hypothetical protein
MYDIQHCLICRPLDSIVSEKARIEPRTVATTALALALTTRLDLIHTRLDLIHTMLDLIHTRLDLILGSFWFMYSRTAIRCGVHLVHCTATVHIDTLPSFASIS